MPLYRKKPVVIVAIQFAGIVDTGFMGLVGPAFKGEMPPWLKYSQLPEGTTHLEEGEWTWNELTNSLFIKTLQGVMIVKKGDYLVQDVNGEIYPCNKEVFELTYEKVE